MAPDKAATRDRTLRRSCIREPVRTRTSTNQTKRIGFSPNKTHTLSTCLVVVQGVDAVKESARDGEERQVLDVRIVVDRVCHHVVDVVGALPPRARHAVEKIDNDSLPEAHMATHKRTAHTRKRRLIDPLSWVISGLQLRRTFSNWGEGEEEGKGRMGKC